MHATSDRPCGCHVPRRECARLPRHGWGGWPQWRLHFAWLPGPASIACEFAQRGVVTRLHIEGLRPSDLQGIEIRRNDCVLYAMESCEGRTGHVATAGELVHAMARMSGLAGLAIDAQHLGQSPLLSELSLLLRVRAVQEDELDGVRVRAWSCRAWLRAREGGRQPTLGSTAACPPAQQCVGGCRGSCVAGGRA